MSRRVAARAALPDLLEATRSYEAWLGQQTRIVAADLKTKHERMTHSPFEFLRATFYRWLQYWEQTCPELAHGRIQQLTVGDLHVENFGTWRDLEGRLIWGINDFDETSIQAPTIDLARLAVSAVLAEKAGSLRLPAGDALAAIIEGYNRGQVDGPVPFVLEEHHGWLRELATGEFREAKAFWARLAALPAAKSSRPLTQAKSVLLSSLPKGADSVRVCSRVAGLGSLGRPRFVALAQWGDSFVCREAKASAPPAAAWLEGRARAANVSTKLFATSTRAADPYYRIDRGWVVRRLAPHCSKIDLAHLPRRTRKTRGDLDLLEAMGFEVANLHRGVRPKGAALSKSDERNLTAAVKRLHDLVMEDWAAWRKHMRQGT